MTLVDTPPEPPALPAAPTPAPSRWRWATLALAVVAVLAIGVAIVAVNRGGRSTNLSARDVATAQQARDECQQWMGSVPAASSAAPGWCGQFSDWMYSQMASGRMMGSTMWGNPQAMRDTCVQAMAGYPDAASDPAAWCQQMVDWMSQHGWSWSGSSMMGTGSPMMGTGSPMMGR